ncbi:MAG: hypothetical protein ACPGUV_11600, partial [Polyangiales bacterium]
PLAKGATGGEMYAHFFDEAMSEALRQGQSLGLASFFDTQGKSQAGVGATVHRLAASPGLGLGAAPFAALAGARAYGPSAGGTGPLGQSAARIVQNGDAQRWSRQGQLTPHDLQSRFATRGPDGIARFNVRDAQGYQGHAKCNLFAFEAVRRAGYQTPVVARRRGWGYPGPSQVANDAANGRVAGGWAKVVQHESSASLDAGARSGQRAFLLASAGGPGKQGHMAVVERIHALRYDSEGHITDIVFDGWDTSKHGAAQQKRQRWQRTSEAGAEGHRYRHVALLELNKALDPMRPEVPLSQTFHASTRDNVFAQVSRPSAR